MLFVSNAITEGMPVEKKLDDENVEILTYDRTDGTGKDGIVKIKESGERFTIHPDGNVNHHRSDGSTVSYTADGAKVKP